MIHITRMETERVHYKADVPDSPMSGENDGAIARGVLAHFRALWDAIDWFDARTLRKFYVELRLWNDEHDPERGRAAVEFGAGDAKAG